MHTFTILGARGSLFTGAESGSRYGQRTTCMALKTPQGMLLIDAGTGLPSALGPACSPGLPPPPITILFTHCHIDHLAGLSLFPALYDSGATVCLRGSPRVPWRAALQGLVAPPYWPMELLACGASIELQDLPSGPDAVEICGVKVAWCPVFHPQECLAYRLEVDGTSYVVATDREQGHPELDSNFLRFCKDADFLIHDAQYLPEEYPRRKGWGHSTFAEAAAVARAAGVGRLILTHHEARRTDAQIDQLLERARAIFKDTEAAMEGMCLPAV